MRRGSGLDLRICSLCAACIFLTGPCSGEAALQAGEASGIVGQVSHQNLPRSAADKVRLTWPMVPGASRYRVVLLSAPEYSEQNVIYGENVSAPAAEIRLEALRGAAFQETFWAVCPFRYGGVPIGGFSKPEPLAAGELCPVSPLLLSDYSTMDEMPVYPVYAWVPVQRTSSYEVEVWRESETGRERVRHYYTYETILYDEMPLTEVGRYTWRVRALDGNGRRWSDWSEPEGFTVKSPVTAAAFGDSITHGGGAVTVPPSRAMYCWESYAGIPVKNIGHSGDNTYELLERFESDVLPFSPSYLVIMAGVNDFRAGTPAWVTIRNLEQLGEKCRANGITPIFATATPIAPDLMQNIWDIEPAAWNWKAEQQQVNEWIMSQPYAVDTASPLTDMDGELSADLTTDGLHPDAEAKRIIGEIVGKYLRERFGLEASLESGGDGK